MKIRLMQSKDWPEVKKIYQEGIDTGNATFENAPPKTWRKWDKKHIAKLSIVAINKNIIIFYPGYIVLTLFTNMLSIIYFNCFF